MKKFGTMEIKNGELFIGGVGISSLVKNFGTPLYIIDETLFKETVSLFSDNFTSDKFETRIIYASKAFSNLYIADLVSELGLFMDVVSGGELYVAQKGGMDSNKLYFHGNNKLPFEISYAMDENVGCFVVDNEYEFSLIEKIASEKMKKVDVLLRVNPGIEAATHKYIQTAKDDSKFGMSIFNEKTKSLIEKMIHSEYMNMRGFHCHIGSQIHDEKFFFMEVETMIAFLKDMSEFFDYDFSELNLGGGFGVYYTDDDDPLILDSFLKDYIRVIEDTLSKNDVHLDVLSIEPGRALINEAGSTIYTVGGIKQTITGKNYLFVDGGMTDNPRHALYEAKYEAAVANKMEEKPEIDYTVAGKCCETGDILIENIKLPKSIPGDILIIPSSGAYTYSMSSNYNKIGRPGVVFVENGNAKLAVRRESYADLIRNDEVRK